MSDSTNTVKDRSIPWLQNNLSVVGFGSNEADSAFQALLELFQNAHDSVQHLAANARSVEVHVMLMGNGKARIEVKDSGTWPIRLNTIDILFGPFSF